MKNLKIKLLTLLSCAIGTFILTGCTDKSVKLVQDGNFPGHPEMTIKTVVDTWFDDGKWSVQNEEGRKIVYFHGKIKPATHRKMVGIIGGESEISSQITRLLYGDNPDKKLLQMVAANLKKLSPPDRSKEIGALEKQIATQEKRNCELRRNYSEENEPTIKENDKKIDALREAQRKLLLEGENYKRKAEVMAFEKIYWPVGEVVEFRWIVYSDGNTYELDLPRKSSEYYVSLELLPYI